MKFDKLETARRQLGVALHLFLDNADPVSVHVLVSGAMEILDAIVEKQGKETFKSTAIEANPGLTASRYNEIKNQYSNAMKHFNNRNGKERNDTHLLDDFSDEQNEGHLLIAWLDYGKATGKLPIEAQVYQAWFFSKYPEKLSADGLRRGWSAVFPDVGQLTMNEQKQALRRRIERERKRREIMEDPRTERRKLVLPSNLAEYER